MYQQVYYNKEYECKDSANKYFGFGVYAGTPFYTRDSREFSNFGCQPYADVYQYCSFSGDKTSYDITNDKNGGCKLNQDLTCVEQVCNVYIQISYYIKNI